MEAANIKRFKELNDESGRFKTLFTEVSLENHTMKEILQKIVGDRPVFRN